MNNPNDTTVTAWARLVHAHHGALSKVEEALKDNDFPPLRWYDVLLELERAGRQGLRPFELEGALLLPQYGISRLIERIENAGYLERQSCNDDGRGQLLAITSAGKKLRRRMWPVYRQAVQEGIGAKLSASQTQALAKLLGKLIE